jgi:DNA polymerase-3 subunit gamma/tau
VAQESSVPYSSPLPENMMEEWREFVNFAKKKKPPLASLLGHGHPLVLSNERLEIGYPKDSFYLERMQERENLPLLEALGSEFFRRPMQVRITGIEPNALPRVDANAGPQDRGTGRNHKKNNAEEALNHPLVREAINIFGGRVVEIKTK